MRKEEKFRKVFLGMVIVMVMVKLQSVRRWVLLLEEVDWFVVPVPSTEFVKVRAIPSCRWL